MARSAPGAVGAAAERRVDVAGLAVDPDLLDAGEIVGHLDALEHAGRGDEELGHRAADARLVRVTTSSAPDAPRRSRARSGRCP